MREYKFRAWDNHDQCWLNSFAIFYNGEFADMAKGVMHGDICQCDINYQKTPSHIIIEQFTGLHDKNGVEIYEGDIVRVSDNGWRDDVKAYEVYYGIKYGYPAFDLKDHTQDVNLLSYYNENGQMEVIGNIHVEVEE